MSGSLKARGDQSRPHHQMLAAARLLRKSRLLRATWYRFGGRCATPGQNGTSGNQRNIDVALSLSCPGPTSSTDWLDRRSPDSTRPAYLIHGELLLGGSSWRTARRTNSSTEIPRAFASFLASSYSSASKLICVRIMLSLSEIMMTERPGPRHQRARRNLAGKIHRIAA